MGQHAILLRLFKKPYLIYHQNIYNRLETIYLFARIRPATLSKKRLWQRCFPVNFAKFLRTLFVTETSGRCIWNLKYILKWWYAFSRGWADSLKRAGLQCVYEKVTSSLDQDQNQFSGLLLNEMNISHAIFPKCGYEAFYPGQVGWEISLNGRFVDKNHFR